MVLIYKVNKGENMDIENRIAIVTGGGGNIGRHIALKLAENGAAVAVVDCIRGTADETVRLIRAAGGRATAFVTDVSDYASVKECFHEIVAHFGAVDYLITAAGGSTRSHMTTLARQSPEIITENIGVNMFGALWFAKETAAYFESGFNADNNPCRGEIADSRGEIADKIGKAHTPGKPTGGRIVFIASILGIDGREGCVEYSAAKGGIIAMSKSLAKELGHLGVTVNCVSPGLVNRPNENTDVRETNFLNEFCTADDIAEAVMYLVGESGRFVTGHNLIVDGGRSLGLKGVK